ncbi:MAG: hypothetical protein IPN19_05440 [Elusimicrobia bacterium]|nr:hypothetical protein [Elusimicrobiota bacterium]
MNKRIVVAVAVAMGMMGLVKSASAASFANAILKVELTGTLSMSIVGSPETILPAVAPGGSSISGSGIVILNDSVGMIQTYSLEGFDSASWLLRQNAGPSQMAIQALFNDVQPGAGDFSTTTDYLMVDPTPLDAVKDGLRPASATDFFGDQSGAAVDPGQQRTLWFKFDAPTTTNSYGARDLVVSIVAGL